MTRLILLGAFFALLFQSCFGPGTAKRFDADEYEMLDTLIVTASRGKTPENESLYQGSEEKRWDLLHVRLDLSFDWQNRAVDGVATLLLKPYFYAQDTLRLDAGKMIIRSVKMGEKPVSFEYDDRKISIPLEREYTREDSLSVKISYKTGVWKGVSEEPPYGVKMGVYFITPTENDPLAPYQVWTQGETEYNSFWFPCIDQPNERITQEIRLRVKDEYSTLSNGILTNQIRDIDGYRTDVWTLDEPHPVYLAAFAVGKYFIASEMVNGLLYQYYVSPPFAEEAKSIYAHTPEMIAFFSSVTGQDYPWPKYGQVTVHDFVAGAMENTSATIFGDFIEKTPPELYDEPNDAIVAHELFHQWFGNYLTCESWANLTLNEGFANYGEYLWAEYKYGKTAAEETRYGFLMNYLFNAMYQVHPLIHHYYKDSEDMFDAHSYDKGALILHLLRTELGDDAFFSGLKQYVRKYAQSDVEADELRMAMEDVSGRDLSVFFDQWFHTSGHPEWSVEMSLSGNELSLSVHQDQFSDKGFALFTFPLEVMVYDSAGNGQLIRLNITKEHTTIRLTVPDHFVLAQIDPEQKFIGRLTVPYTEDDYRSIYLLSENPISRYLAFKALSVLANTDTDLNRQYINDPYYRIRYNAIQAMDSMDGSLVAEIRRLSFDDSHPLVRQAAIEKMASFADDSYYKDLSIHMASEPSQRVLLSGFAVLSESSPSLAVTIALQYLFHSSFPLQEASFIALYQNKNTGFLPLMEKALNHLNGKKLDILLKYYTLMAGELGEEARIHARSWLNEQVKTKSSSDPDHKILIKYKQSLL